MLTLKDRPVKLESEDDNDFMERSVEFEFQYVEARVKTFLAQLQKTLRRENIPDITLLTVLSCEVDNFLELD